jgi:hypothetical protein
MNINRLKNGWVVGAAFVAALAGGSLGIIATQQGSTPTVREHKAATTDSSVPAEAAPAPVEVPSTTVVPTIITTTPTTATVEQRVGKLETEVHQLETTTTQPPPATPPTTMAPQPEGTTTSTTDMTAFCAEHPGSAQCPHDADASIGTAETVSR